MATFSKKSFNAVAYAASRPRYPHQLYQHILAYAAPLPPASPTAPHTVVDLGCGPGLSTFSFVPAFDRVIGLDPGAGMVQTAREIAAERKSEWEGKEVTFELAQGEDLSLLPDGSVDLVVAAQAAHWFDHDKVYPELRRVLKPGGTFAYWGYGEVFFPGRPNLTRLIPEYSAGILGKYWQQPGRSIVEDLLRPVPFPDNDPSPLESASTIARRGRWSLPTFSRTYFVTRGGKRPIPDPSVREKQIFKKLMLVHQWGLDEIEAYFRTWSSAHTYDEQHGEGSDVVGQMMEKMHKAFMKETIEKDATIDVAWEMVVLAGKKEA